MKIVVAHHANQEGKRLVDKRGKDLGVWTVQDRTECHYGCLTLVPVLRLDVCFDERDDGGHDGIRDSLCHIAETSTGAHGKVPFTLVSVLVLLR
jgi:hypothetical protein